MSFELEYEVESGFDFDEKQLAQSVVSFCLKHEGFPCAAQVSLTLTDDEGIRQYNSRYRGLDRPTDVLSFPLLSYQKPGDFSFLTERRGEDFDPDTGEAVLGDIIISADKVREQAEAYGHSERREFAFLIVHSMLHLMGYDHIQEQEAAVMEEKQRQILEAMEIRRDEA